MYYLLETNYIISENEIKEEGFKIVDNAIGKWEKLDNKFGIKEWFNDYYGFIKKQSDNVLDLIEVGDLIRYNDEFLGAFPLREVYLHNGELQLLDEINIKCLDITEIYKPNTNGDYIKVWEKESE